MLLQFDMPAGLEAEKFIARLSSQVNLRLLSRQKMRVIFYDSFDWRLYSSTMAGEFIRAKPASYFQLKSLETGLVIAKAELNQVPAFSKQFKTGKLRNILEPILEMRALLALCSLEYQIYYLDIVNKEDKTVLRIVIEEYQQFNNRVCLQPLKGYEKTARHCIEILAGKLHLTAAGSPLLEAALQLQGRKPKDYSCKLQVNLQTGMPASTAVKSVFNGLVKIIRANEPGILADTDSEFLHDFRVAVRKTRTGLSQFKEAVPDKICTRCRAFFSWLGQVTGPTRDLDVYLLKFDTYKNSLPIAIREDINPLQQFLLAKKHSAHQELATYLHSQQYKTGLAEWQAYLDEAGNCETIAPDSDLTIKQIADVKIWKNYRRVLRKGSAINDLSGAEAFHALRKACKRLRYLLEFFQSLYTEHRIKSLLKKLKDLQDVLGDIQDYEVQQRQLKNFSSEMLAADTHANTFLAMGVLIQNLETQKRQARKHFASRFEAFKMAEKELLLNKLFLDI